MTETVTKEQLIAELIAELLELGIDVRELQRQAARERKAVKVIAEAAVRAGKLIRGEEEPDDGD